VVWAQASLPSGLRWCPVLEFSAMITLVITFRSTLPFPYDIVETIYEDEARGRRERLTLARGSPVRREGQGYVHTGMPGRSTV
jgi:hypothetical protein